MATRTSVVVAALIANGAIAILKFAGFLLTGSAAMLSETYHSISDTGNQVFLLVGIRYGGREATRSHPFGHGKAQFFYSFLVSVMLFGIAGWESTKHGYDVLVAGHGRELGGSATLPVLGTFDAVYVNYAVLLGAIAFESYAFAKAYEAIRKQMDDYGWESFREAFSKTSDVTTLTALTEDTIALAGAGIALFAVYLTRRTGNPVYDGAAAVLIGVMLMGFAVALAVENKRLLLGESLPEDVESDLRTIVEDGDGVAGTTDFRTVYFGPEHVLVAADVAFDPGLEADEIDRRIETIERELRDRDGRVKTIFLEPETGT